MKRLFARLTCAGGVKRRLVLLVSVSLLLALTACSSRQPTPGFVLDGPPLFVAADYAGLPLEGYMDRRAMVGIGEMVLASKDNSLSCKAVFNVEPSDKARIRVVLICADNRTFSLTMRNLGPDQGVGIGLEPGKDELLVLFYHPSEEEARRRLPQAATDMKKARAAARK